MDALQIKLEPRDVTGKKVAGLRKDGMTPAVVYGHGMPTSANMMAPSIEMHKVFAKAGRHHPVQLQIDGKKKLAMIKSADIDPVKHRLRHISFYTIRQNEKVEAEVPIRMRLPEGDDSTPAERAGLVVLKAAETIQIKALPKDLPEALEYDGEKLVELNDKITIADLEIPEGVEVSAEPEQTIANVYEPSALQAANDAAGGDEDATEADVESENGEDTDQESQAEEDQPGGKKQFEPKGE